MTDAATATANVSSQATANTADRVARLEGATANTGQLTEDAVARQVTEDAVRGELAGATANRADLEATLDPAAAAEARSEMGRLTGQGEWRDASGDAAGSQSTTNRVAERATAAGASVPPQ